eukprot:1040845-Amorphochlora_amoeboformis.AAC.1
MNAPMGMYKLSEYEPRALTSAFESSSSFAVERFPFAHAVCRGVSPGMETHYKAHKITLMISRSGPKLSWNSIIVLR